MIPAYPNSSFSRNVLFQPEWTPRNKPISLPLVDKKVFNGRPEDSVKDGVWIQVQPNAEESLAVHDAIVEQRKIDKTIEEKQEKLKQFQRDVQRRVTRITRAQRDLVVKTQTDNMKEEQDVLYRSVAAAENVTPKKNRCTFNVNPVTIDACGKLMPQSLPGSRDNKGPTMLTKQSIEVEKLHMKARQNLLQKQLGKQNGDGEENEVDDKSLPGGFWGTSTTRDKSAARLLLPPSTNEKLQAPEHDQVQTITASSAPHDIAIAAVQEGIVSSPHIKSRLQNVNVKITLDLPTALRLDNVDKDEEDEENQDPESCPPPASSLSPSTIHFRAGANREWKSQDVIPCGEKPSLNPQNKMVAVTKMGTNLQPRSDTMIKLHRCTSATEESLEQKTSFPCAAPGVVEHQRRKMDERNRLLCRRVFSDIEREKVREERRKREHKCKVERLRAEKEAERMQQEMKHDENVHAAAARLEQAKLREEMKEKRKIKKQQEKVDKQKRATRFASALKAQIKERLENNQIELPPLCCCSTTFLGTDPYTCANNCIFYRNMEAYTIALQSVLSSIERHTTSYRHEKTQDHSVISLILNDE